MTSDGNIGRSEVGCFPRVGDQICLFPTVSTPLVLRKAEDMGKLVGPCYLYDYMDTKRQSEVLSQNSEAMVEFALI